MINYLKNINIEKLTSASQPVLGTFSINWNNTLIGI